MSVLFADKITAQIESPDSSKRLPSPIAVLFAKAGVSVPADGRKIPIGEVDHALKGLNVEERLRLKGRLKELRLID
ncbi:MAG: hypothetical protein PSV22_25365 [Pseudolabrys sp.]|jgi:hypothetical protein|nr:hypothetical protein [Pseudolabrys sp.]